MNSFDGNAEAKMTRKGINGGPRRFRFMLWSEHLQWSDTFVRSSAGFVFYVWRTQNRAVQGHSSAKVKFFKWPRHQFWTIFDVSRRSSGYPCSEPSFRTRTLKILGEYATVFQLNAASVAKNGEELFVAEAVENIVGNVPEQLFVSACSCLFFIEGQSQALLRPIAMRIGLLVNNRFLR